MMIVSAARSISRDVPGRYTKVWWIKQTVSSRKNHSIYHGSNQSTLAIDTTKTPTAVQFQKKSCITADDDPLCCEINFS
jgi:hypothetical protein